MIVTESNKFSIFLAPSTYESILHELEKNHKKQDADSQTVKKVSKLINLKILKARENILGS